MDLEDQIQPQSHFVLQNPQSNLLTGVKFGIITMGCAHNQADSDAIASKFLQYGVEIVPSDECEVLFINSCTVKTPSQEKALYQVQKASENGQVVILGGCVPQSLKSDHRIMKLQEANQLFTIGVLDDELLLELINNLKTKQKFEFKTKPVLARHDPAPFPEFHSNPNADIIPLCQGCLGSCTYCKTVQSRGRLVSYDSDKIITRVESALNDQKVQELWFTGEDTLAWGLDKGTDFYELFERIFALFESKGSRKMIRIGMTDPESVVNNIDKLIKVMSHKNVYKFLHLPVQSGSDSVLLSMRRRYKYSEYVELYQKLTTNVKNIVIATDFIVGYPGETDEDHQKSIECIQKINFEVVNVTQFYPREGTPAARMEQLKEDVKKRRSLEASQEAVKCFNREKYVGQEMDVIVSEVLPYQDGFRNQRAFAGKSYNYLSVLIECVYEAAEKDKIIEELGKKGLKIGEQVRVKIVGTTRVALVGKLCE